MPRRPSRKIGLPNGGPSSDRGRHSSTLAFASLLEEAWDFIERSHTGVFGTLRSDGTPIMLPIWFVVIERKIYVRTSADSKKANRARRNPRASFLVECGERWAELQAVHMVGEIREVDVESSRGAKQRRSSRRSTHRSEPTILR